ncbi:hypothetical protein KCP75_07375 [Salmonella enterica subsp. enterica]|nr:hypothetical protein KCP75_07375 [Salmonella enterica subsp. enterica]
MLRLNWSVPPLGCQKIRRRWCQNHRSVIWRIGLNVGSVVLVLLLPERLRGGGKGRIRLSPSFLSGISAVL